MHFVESIYRGLRVGLVIALLASALRLDAQVLDVPDSSVVYMTSPSLFQLVDPEIAAAALGRRHVITIDVPSGPRWARIASHLMAVTNARAPAPSDSVVLALALTDIHLESDTLVASLMKEIRFRCPDRWMRTGTSYEVRTIRVKGVSDGWTAPVLTPKETWDSFGCPISH
jgi:hypothetical protein